MHDLVQGELSLGGFSTFEGLRSCYRPLMLARRKTRLSMFMIQMPRVRGDKVTKYVRIFGPHSRAYPLPLRTSRWIMLFVPHSNILATERPFAKLAQDFLRFGAGLFHVALYHGSEGCRFCVSSELDHTSFEECHLSFHDYI